MAELERLYNADAVRWFSDTAALVDSDSFTITHLGGTQKAGRVIIDLPNADWRAASERIVRYYTKAWATRPGKTTLGISTYGFNLSPREVQKTGLTIKSQVKKMGVSLRLIPNTEKALNTATSHHNKLGLSDNKVELLIVRSRSGRVIVAESTGAQNITAYAKRDQGRPKRDAFVGMLPPKLAQMMLNMALAKTNRPKEEDLGTAPRVLDPFCGTGVVLQEASLMGYRVYGTDLADKMIDYTEANLAWLETITHHSVSSTLRQGDATTTTWEPPIDAVVCESYLGQPFSAPPSPSKLEQVRGNCNHIISEFLTNIGSQLKQGAPLCVAVPAWRDGNGDFHHLPLIKQLEKLGYTQITLKNVKNDELLYFREDQIVARELLLLVKA
jgi:tRNA G10  N-methylase Trm11